MNQNVDTLTSFIMYCRAHPEQRFWQALRNWSGFCFIYAGNISIHIDTFYFKGKDK